MAAKVRQVVDDETLYRQVQNGSEAAFVELITRYHSPISKFLCRYTGDAALAEDLVQETFTRLLTHRGKTPGSFKAWVYTIATNLARDVFKSAFYRHEQTLDTTEDSELYPDEAAAEEFELIEVNPQPVAAALARLQPAHREVVILRFYHDLKLEQIAEITGAPLSTVKSRLFHALKQLKGLLVAAPARKENAPQKCAAELARGGERSAL